MYKKTLLSILVLAALAGCNDEDTSIIQPDIDTETHAPVLPEEGTDGSPDIGVPDPIIAGEFSLDGSLVFGPSVTCNGEAANAFEFSQNDAVVCEFDGTVLATFSDIFAEKEQRSVDTPTRLRLTLENASEFIDSPEKLRNARTLITAVAPSHDKQIDFPTLSTSDTLAFSAMYNNDLDLPQADFDKLLEEEAPVEESLVDKLPSTHVPDIEPEVTEGAVADLNAPFVSANAEEAYQYKPETSILSKAVITDSNGKAVQGLSYFSRSSRGKTNELGEFEFVWGETISFGIETFELGGLRGNQTQFTLRDLGVEQRGRNAEALVKRYATTNAGNLSINTDVEKVFSQYPNVINEAISLSLNDKDIPLDVGAGQIQTVKAEFETQFTSGIAQQIDKAICGENCDQSASQFDIQPDVRVATDEMSNIQADINKLWGINDAVSQGWKPVDKFHVFADATWFYGSVGTARGQAAVNISNRAFPVVMARNDNNYWIEFDKPKAYDERGLAYITESPVITPDLAGGNTATYGLPFVSIGELGSGKIMVMGNARYNSVLVCPTGYSWGGNSQCENGTDGDDMKNFFNNVIRYLTNRAENASINVGTNIPHVYFTRAGITLGHKEAYVIADDFNVTTEQISSFSNISPIDMPLLILNGFDYNGPTGDVYLPPHTANTDSPKLTQDDVTALIQYVSDGGSILVMETLRATNNAGELGRLLDAAGIAFGMGESVVPTGNGPNDGYADRVRSNREYGLYIIERYAPIDGENGEQPKLPYNIDKVTGEVTWDHIIAGKPDKAPKLETAYYFDKLENGEEVAHKAFIREEDHFVRNDKGHIDVSNGEPVVDTESLRKAIDDLLEKFEVNGQRTYEQCTDYNYHYEINCLEYRPGNGIPLTGGMSRPIYTKLDLGEKEARAMIKAADLGTNIERLYQHERYFRTNGKQGERLSSIDLNRLYTNMSVWLWNDLDYRYESGKDDDLGFEKFTEFLNCYTNNIGAEGTQCSQELGNQLTVMEMVYGPDAGEYAGQMNPSYPLNYMEKPLTRLMLGRSFWDYDVIVDIRQFPGEPDGFATGKELTFDMSNNPVAYYAGNRQATGQWAVAHQPVTVNVAGNSTPVTFTIGLHDDLTGREKHELGLKRPPRMQKSYSIQSSGEFTVPYGGLIYVQGGNSEAVSIKFNGSVAAPLFDGTTNEWVNPQHSPAPMGDVVSNSFIYTAPKANMAAKNFDGGMAQFASDLDTFAQDMNEFYARDEGINGQNNRAVTHADTPNNRHAFVNDVAISIGAAHSGYPVMNSSFNADSEHMPTTPLNDWLIWHEVGHNAAEAPLTVEGATEVANNVLGLYMQQKYLGKMPRVERDIRIAPQFVNAENGHAWGAGGAGERLLMFAQLKEWADTELDITQWYEGELPDFYNQELGMNGFNLYKLMHRLTRNQSENGMRLVGQNQCYQSNLGKSDALLLCASYAAQTDLTAFFDAWNPGVVASILPGQSQPQYGGGISDAGRAAVKALNLPLPMRNPLNIDSVTVGTPAHQ
ncbi:SslE/AcfD family lipoprotein zinc metalloprotease [Enterovibrio sp. ZSDZ42]|uniref:SslE/AcfD family lipoprotein zinc metalloprotease n=1 Tax=Enterovibrio gelatinilyticus TaxID=2899819 RepID=A0ABT5QZE5_9GAMM|nr:SslE/AcfD family lipoprotein zinc metalloprotease [Enterovibrio sp. ZSDZ42]MDD1793381.1 SslE/AcfD family lipoprotein zinc metalloprotease [Enterovibrio sp. ZSDZ42]